MKKILYLYLTKNKQMGLIKFIKSLFAKAEVMEKEVETKSTEIAEEIKTEVEKVKKAKKKITK
jgi:O-methyltransferase involved in polyketide biosynthesis